MMRRILPILFALPLLFGLVPAWLTSAVVLPHHVGTARLQVLRLGL